MSCAMFGHIKLQTSRDLSKWAVHNFLCPISDTLKETVSVNVVTFRWLPLKIFSNFNNVTISLHFKKN